MKQLLLLFSFFCMTITLHANMNVDFENSEKSGNYYKFPNLTITSNPGDKGYSVRIMFTRPVTSNDKITLPALPSGWNINPISTQHVQVVGIPAGAEAADIQNFLRSVQISFDPAKFGQSIKVLISEYSTDTGRRVYYSSDTDHWYEYVPSSKITWTSAYNAALSRTFMGMTGYLVVITSVVENSFITSLINGDSWTAGTRMDIRPVTDPVTGLLTANPSSELNYWYWSAGPEWENNSKNPLNSVFYNKKTYDSTPQSVPIKYAYTYWDNQEPNNYSTGEYYTHLYSHGRWNDYAVNNTNIAGYIVEYKGSLAGEIGIIGFESSKKASINGGAVNNGTSGSPVRLVHGDELLYTITAINASDTSTLVIIRDTVPTGLEVITSSISPGGIFNNLTREIEWNVNIPSENAGIVSYKAKKSVGATNIIVNTATVISNGPTIKHTNSTYHKGAHVTFNFSCGPNGTITNATTQFIEYNQNPLAGVIVTPNTGYQFNGWSYPACTCLKGNPVPAASNIADYTTINAVANKTLTASFSITNYNITYNLDGGNPGSPSNPTSYTVETPDFTLSNPTKTGYEFLGWTGSNGPTPQKTITIPIGSTEDRNYTANWQAIEYTITYDGKGGNTPTSNPVKYKISDATITLMPSIRLGYTFSGWKISSDSTGVTIPTGSTIPTGTYGNLTCEAQWATDTYNITYTLDGGTVSGNPATYQITDLTITLNDPTKAGYRFAGWTGSNGTTPQTSYTIPSNTTGNLNYTANWTMDTYTIHYDYKEGVAPTIPNKASFNVTDATFTISNQPTRTGYTFKGWTGSNGSTPELTVTIPNGSTGDKNYEANWEAINYTITYNSNGGSSPTNPGSYNITSPTITLAPSIRPGYTFEGWEISSDSSGVTIPTGSSIPTGTYGNLTCNALWNKISYTISYNYNGGIGHPTPNPIFYDVTTTTITLNPPSRNGYTFTNWTITSDSTGITIPTGSIIPTGTYGNLTCIANWNPIPYNITYDYAGGIDPGNAATYTIETPTFTLTNPTKPGKTFVGWTSSNDTIKQTIITIPKGTNGDLAYTTHWNYNFSDRYGTSDTLYNCSPSITLESGYDGLSYLWLFPDGSSQSTPSILAPVSGYYYLQTNYGSMILTDSIYVLYAFDDNISYVRQASNIKIKIRNEEIFKVDLNPLLTNVSYQWNIQGGTLLTSTSNTAKVIFETYGDKKISVDVTVTLNGQTCQKTFYLDITLYNSNLGRGFFVDQHVAGGLQNGSSWANAYKTIQEALSQAAEGDYIWVAKGEYTPDYNSSFMLAIDSIEIYGGFDAWESHLYERAFYQNPTILKGNGNSVIINSNIAHSSRWDGFIIEGGNANKGGGIFNNKSSATIANCIIRGNIADEEGGGIYSSLSSPLLYNVEISGNQAEVGAGMANNFSNLHLVNTTLSGNMANENGGGIYNENSNLELNNTIIWGNRSKNNPNVYNETSAPFYSYSLIEGSGGSSNWNDLFGSDRGNNIDASPLFKKNGFAGNGSMQAGNYQLSTSSLAANKGLNKYIYDIPTRWGINLESLDDNTMITGVPFDLAGMERIQDDRIDIGAYETGTETIKWGILRGVLLPEVEGLITDPVAGRHYVRSHEDFIFTIWAKDGKSLDGLIVKTGIELRDREGIRMVQNEDGSVTVTILQVTEPLEISINGVTPTDNEDVNEPRVWSYESNVYISTPKETNVKIYNMAGQLFSQKNIEAGDINIELPHGFYNISLDGIKTYKIVIK